MQYTAEGLIQLLCWNTLNRVRETNEETTVVIWKRDVVAWTKMVNSRGGERNGQVLGCFFKGRNSEIY